MEENKGLVPFRPAESQEGEGEIVSAVLKDLEAQRENASSYFSLVPDKYRSHVRAIAENSFSEFEGKFENLNSFLEAISKNWLAKYLAFDRLAESHGFTKLKEGEDLVSIGYDGRWPLAILTRSASYLLVAPNTNPRDGVGIIYSRIALRASSLPEIISNPAGSNLVNSPCLDGRVSISGSTKLTTSPTVSIYYQRTDEAVDQNALADDMNKSFIDVNAQTLH